MNHRWLAGDAVTTNEDTSTTINVLANDTNEDGGSVVTITQAPTHGTASVDGSQSIAYAPSSNYHGADSVKYTVTDSDGDVSSPATVSITVTSVDESPVATGDAVTTNEDTSTTINVLANDTNEDGGSVVTITQAPTHGTASVDGSQSITYAPSSNYHGADSVKYTVTDSDGDVSSAGDRLGNRHLGR